MTTSSAAGGTEPLGSWAERNGLLKVGRRDPLPRYVRNIWRRRAFAVRLAQSRVGAKNSEDVLGPLWTILRPLLLAGVFYLVFGVILPRDALPGMDPFFAMLVTAIFVFQYTGQSLNSGARSITSNMSLVRAIRFPRAVLPISAVLVEALQFLPMLAILFVILPIAGADVGPAWLLVVPAFVLQTMFNVGAAMLVARLTAKVRDFANLLPFFVRLGFYLSGIFFTAETIAQKNEAVAQWLPLNPAYTFINITREALVHGQWAGMTWLWATLWAVGVFVVGFLVFWRAEETYVDA